jgi:tetratricopeptide (TPR) repeat protein
VNKDNVLFAVIGILLGFISGYLLHEVMAARQPPRLRPGDVAAAAAGGGVGAPDATAEAGDANSPSAANAGDATAGAPGMGDPTAAGAAAPGGAGAPMAAIQQLRENVEKNPNDADAVLKLANANFDIHRWDRARELYAQYLKLKPDQPDILSDLGITYRELGQFDQALEQFQKAEKLAPTHWQARYNQAVVLGIDLKRYDDAQKVLADIEKLQPGNPDVAKLAAEVDRRRKAA